ncbi:MAG: four helix bundle protein [Chthoniobacterales bacterium]
MPLIDNFQDFEAFKRSREFVKQVGLLSHSGRFAEDLTLVHQNRKALLSILSNFAEGFEKDGNQEFRQFLSISKGSVGEVRAHLIYALDQAYIDLEAYKQLDRLGEEASKLIGGLMKHLSVSGLKGRKFKRCEAPKRLLRHRSTRK